MIPEYLISFDTEYLSSEEVDFLIVGGGIAGLTAGFQLSNFKTVILLKDGIVETCTYNAQGGIAVAINEEDTPESHIEDTLKAGCGLADGEAVKTLVREGIERVKELINLGIKFDSIKGRFHFTKEGGHSCNRILHANGDLTGKRISEFLYKLISLKSGVKILHSNFLIDLISLDNRVYGGIILDEVKKKLYIIKAKSVILATGGAGNLFQETTNPAGITGDGISIAYRKGVELTDLEFYQFHPTTFYMAGAPRFLISESVRGEGGILKNSKGERFMFDYHPAGELAARDIVSRSIIDQMKKTNSNCVYLDLRHIKLSYLKKRFPGIYRFCRNYGIDLRKDMIPVRPAAHYFMGGIKTDLWGQTNLENLFACGECACLGVHGANRLASNSLLEGLVFGARTGKKASENIRKKIPHFKIKYKFPQKADILIDKEDLKRSIKSLMWRNVGIERDKEFLEIALKKLTEWQKYAFLKEFSDRYGFETLNMLILTTYITKSALLREESRGTHFRKDFPEKDDKNWKKHIIVSKDTVRVK